VVAEALYACVAGSTSTEYDNPLRRTKLSAYPDLAERDTLLRRHIVARFASRKPARFAANLPLSLPELQPDEATTSACDTDSSSEAETPSDSEAAFTSDSEVETGSDSDLHAGSDSEDAIAASDAPGNAAVFIGKRHGLPAGDNSGSGNVNVRGAPPGSADNLDAVRVHVGRVHTFDTVAQLAASHAAEAEVHQLEGGPKTGVLFLPVSDGWGCDAIVVPGHGSQAVGAGAGAGAGCNDDILLLHSDASACQLDATTVASLLGRGWFAAGGLVEQLAAAFPGRGVTLLLVWPDYIDDGKYLDTATTTTSATTRNDATAELLLAAQVRVTIRIVGKAGCRSLGTPLDFT
jgi:hypothetical protein